MGEFELFKRIVSEYEGKIIERENEVLIIAKTKACGCLSKAPTEWTISVRAYVDQGKKHYLLSGHEKGHWSGFSTTFNEEMLRLNLERCKFILKRRQNKQLSLFDI